MNHQNPTADLFTALLNELDIATRVRLAEQATAGRAPNEALSVLFGTLNMAVDYAKTITEVALEMGLPADELSARFVAKSRERSPAYLHYEFDRIVDGLDDEPQA